MENVFEFKEWIQKIINKVQNVAHKRNRRVSKWFDNSCHCFVVINVTQAHWHHTMECWCSSFRTVFVVDKVVPVGVLISVKFNYMYFMTSLQGKNEVEVVHWHTHWDVREVVLVHMIFTKWYPSEYWSLTKFNYFYDLATR